MPGVYISGLFELAVIGKNNQNEKVVIFAIVEKSGKIEIKVVGKSGNEDLKPDNYDIRHIVK
ncbi:MAG: hypothetical protein D6714_08590, partial [Bacteroidetes bacterium]